MYKLQKNLAQKKLSIRIRQIPPKKEHKTKQKVSFVLRSTSE